MFDFTAITDKLHTGPRTAHSVKAVDAEEINFYRPSNYPTIQDVITCFFPALARRPAKMDRLRFRIEKLATVACYAVIQRLF